MPISTPGNSKAQREGFSLIELLVVMALIVLFTGMMTPSLVSFYAESRLRSGLRTLVAQCQYARDQAVSRNVAVRVNWDVEAGTHFITLEQPPQEGSAEAEFVPEGTELGGIQRLPTGVTYTGILFRENRSEELACVTFTPDGRAEEVALLLENTRGTRRAVAIDGLTGRCQVVSLEELKQAGFPVP